MTVADLLERLSELPADADIVFNVFDTDWFEKGYTTVTFAAISSDDGLAPKRAVIEFNMPGYKAI